MKDVKAYLMIMGAAIFWGFSATKGSMTGHNTNVA